MPEVICPSCQKINMSENGSPRGLECTFCFEPIPLTSESTVSRDQNNVGKGPSQVGRKVSGLTLIYQIDQRRIQIGASGKTILGRKSFGSEVFATILYNGEKVISRSHCSIDYRDGDFFIQDEGSKNGTFYGVRKVSCKNTPQLIEHNSLIYLGEEPFVAQIIQTEYEIDERSGVRTSSFNPGDVSDATGIYLRDEVGPEGIYRCNETDCGFETTEKLLVCPKCSTAKSFNLILKEKRKTQGSQ